MQCIYVTYVRTFCPVLRADDSAIHSVAGAFGALSQVVYVCACARGGGGGGEVRCRGEW